MSNRHIESLTHRLLQALDNNYDVVDMDAVLSVIAALENTKITKEQLEATRLAKYINLFRRRTKSEQLAKRAKSLLKRWREMVGIQQPPTTTGQTMLGSSNDIQYVGPTSPIDRSIGGGINVGGAFGNTFNTTTTSDKQTKSNTRIEDKNEPTSFVNLIPNFSSSNIPTNSNTMGGFMTNGPSVRSGRKNRGFKQQNETLFNSEQQQLVNSTTTGTLNMSSMITPTIVIDIDDSNSGSNVIEKHDDVVIIGETTKTSSSSKPSKPKKAKKDKKRPRDARETSSSTTLVVIDAESSQSQQQQNERIISTNIPMPDKPDDKSRNSNLATTTNMSEILSLSNSSMSCVFPSSSVGDIKNAYSLKKSRPLTESDLSFAGKFGGTAINTAAKTIVGENLATNTTTVPSSSHTGDIYVYNENSNVGGGATSSGTALKNSNKNRIFGGGSGYNSNDSISNSRHSNFEIVDSVSQGIPNEAINIVGAPSEAVPPTIPVEKIPKKRGRKKGSKGVDSLIAKDTSLSSQMLMQSLSGGSKKVKTTKELYAEMQNRKLGVSTPTTPSHWTGVGSSSQQQIQHRRRDSFCSEPSLHSPRTFDACSTNATISTIATSSTTPDKSVIASRKFLDAGVVDVDSSSDSLMSGAMSHESVGIIRESTSTTTNTLTAVEQQLQEFVKTLPPVPSVTDLETQCANDIVPCSCKIIEKMPELTENETETETEKPNDIVKEASELSNFDNLKNTNLSTVGVNVKGEPTTIIPKIENIGNDDDLNTKPIEPAKPKKSIFDLDFDEDEDPLHTLIAEVAAAKTNQLAAAMPDDVLKIENDAMPPQNTELEITIENQNIDEALRLSGSINSFALDPLLQPAPSSSTEGFPLPQFPTYTIEEDPYCLAKQRFELQTQQITEFHINLLHNFFIPNVNGNWNDAIVDSALEKKPFEVTDGSNVVPKLNDEDRIQKDLREFSFQRNFKPKSINLAASSLKSDVPFLGVARCLTKTHRKTRKNRQKRSEKLTIKKETSKETSESSSIKMEEIQEIQQQQEEKMESEIVETVAEVTEPHIKIDSMEVDVPPTAWNLPPVNQQKAALEAISINVDNDDDDVDDDYNDKRNINLATATDSQNLLTIASNVVGDFNVGITHRSTEEDVLKKTENIESVTKLMEHPEPEPEQNISGDIFNNNNNNNNNLSLKYEEEISSCESNSSLKQTQNSINQKLREHRRQQRRQQLELEQNSPKSSTKRKRRRKKQKTPPPIKIKCIKIAINGGITTQRHIQMATSSATNSNSSDEDYTPDDEEDENETATEIAGNNEARQYNDDDDDNDDAVHRQSDSEEITQEDEEPEEDWEELKSNKDEENDYEAADFELEDENIEYGDGDGDDDEAEGDDDGDGDGDNYFGDFHEVVTRDLSPLTALGNNHIVLTIKKTPSKTNSPVSSNSPNVTNQPITTNTNTTTITIQTNVTDAITTTTATTLMPNPNQTAVDEASNNFKLQQNDTVAAPPIDLKVQVNNKDKDNGEREGEIIKRNNFMAAAYSSLINNMSGNRHVRRRRRKIIKKQPPPFRFPDEVADETSTENRKFVKKHQQLFFPYEIYTQTGNENNKRRRIFEMSSCSSSCEESSEFEDETDTSEDEGKQNNQKIPETNKSPIKAETKTKTNTSSDESSDSDSSDLSATDNDSESDSDDEHKINSSPVKVMNEENNAVKDEFNNAIEDHLPVENNGLLVSFNDICVASPSSVEKKDEAKVPSSSSTLSSLEFNQCNNLEKISLLKWNPRSEFCTGIRVVNKTEDNGMAAATATTTGMGTGTSSSNNNQQQQQFREWHQLLQLKSYNDELLTVLPYVVLD